LILIDLFLVRFVCIGHGCCFGGCTKRGMH
jgi:hypothetical protein